MSYINFKIKGGYFFYKICKFFKFKTIILQEVNFLVRFADGKYFICIILILTEFRRYGSGLVENSAK